MSAQKEKPFVSSAKKLYKIALIDLSAARPTRGGNTACWAQPTPLNTIPALLPVRDACSPRGVGEEGDQSSQRDGRFFWRPGPYVTASPPCLPLTLSRTTPLVHVAGTDYLGYVSTPFKYTMSTQLPACDVTRAVSELAVFCSIPSAWRELPGGRIAGWPPGLVDHADVFLLPVTRVLDEFSGFVSLGSCRRPCTDQNVLGQWGASYDKFIGVCGGVLYDRPLASSNVTNLTSRSLCLPKRSGCAARQCVFVGLAYLSTRRDGSSGMRRRVAGVDRAARVAAVSRRAVSWARVDALILIVMLAAARGPSVVDSIDRDVDSRCWGEAACAAAERRGQSIDRGTACAGRAQPPVALSSLTTFSGVVAEELPVDLEGVLQSLKSFWWVEDLVSFSGTVKHGGRNDDELVPSGTVRRVQRPLFRPGEGRRVKGVRQGVRSATANPRRGNWDESRRQDHGSRGHPGMTSSCWRGARSNFSGQIVPVAVARGVLRSTALLNSVATSDPIHAIFAGRVGREAVQCWDTEIGCAQPATSVYLILSSMGSPTARLYHGEPGSIPDRITPDYRRWGSARMMPLVGGFSQGSPVFPPLHSNAAPFSPSFIPSSALETSLVAAESLIETRYRRRDCTPVQCSARRGDERVDVVVSVAPTLPRS
ncbi:hypothetical protein PR048_032739 [Dryococelus australis]|uniref:Uncharacterized protein n=1 Tax=Dryococelus australis TaxID=614101 RepID=A0ABQ9G612_9NEOP|nr:hypothetical protein PR048_032739 [Dryococelus australis]